jgi:hypothetical protein
VGNGYLILRGEKVYNPNELLTEIRRNGARIHL